MTGLSGDGLRDGGAGSDTADYSAATGDFKLHLELTGAQSAGSAGSDTLVPIENLIGGAGRAPGGHLACRGTIA